MSFNTPSSKPDKIDNNKDKLDSNTESKLSLKQEKLIKLTKLVGGSISAVLAVASINSMTAQNMQAKSLPNLDKMHFENRRKEDAEKKVIIHNTINTTIVNDNIKKSNDRFE